jgi:uncharacterized protein (TIGR03067 family)
MEQKGQVSSEETLRQANMRLTFKENTLEIRSTKIVDMTTFKVHPTTSPMGLDIISKDKGTEVAIYKIEDDLLFICYSDTEKPRPAEFRTSVTSGGGLMVLKRVTE